MNQTDNANEKFTVIKESEEMLKPEQLEKVEGGGTDCTCDCWIANSNTNDGSKNKGNNPKPNTDADSNDKIIVP